MRRPDRTFFLCCVHAYTYIKNKKNRVTDRPMSDRVNPMEMVVVLVVVALILYLVYRV